MLLRTVSILGVCGLAVTLAAQYISMGFNAGAGGGTTHTFTYVSRGTGCSTGNGTASITCTANAAGDLIVLISAGFQTGSPTCSVSGMTVSPVSPGTNGNETLCLAYVKSAASGSQTYAVTWGNVTVNSTIAHEFSCSPACSSVTLTADAFGQQTGGTSATPINTPSLTPSPSGQLLIGGAYQGGIASGCGGTWTVSGAVISGDVSCYILSSASGATALNITESNMQDHWGSIMGAFE